MKVTERVLERRLRQAVEIDKMQFGFRPGTGTTDVVDKFCHGKLLAASCEQFAII